MAVKAGDWIEYDTGERGVVRSVQPYFGAIVEYWVEFPDKFESVTSDDSKPVKPTFNDLERWATSKGFRLERGGPEHCHGARSGYMLWLPRGTWLRVGTLKEAFDRIDRYH